MERRSILRGPEAGKMERRSKLLGFLGANFPKIHGAYFLRFLSANFYEIFAPKPPPFTSVNLVFAREKAPDPFCVGQKRAKWNAVPFCVGQKRAT